MIGKLNFSCIYCNKLIYAATIIRKNKQYHSFSVIYTYIYTNCNAKVIEPLQKTYRFFDFFNIEIQMFILFCYWAKYYVFKAVPVIKIKIK